MAEKCKTACSSASHLTPKQKQKIVNIIGEKCMISCQINGRDENALWDTGSQVCLISKQRLVDSGFDVSEIRNLTELIGREIEVEGVGGFAVPYEGYVTLSFNAKGMEIEVPFLVTKEKLQNPIIGYNVISHLVRSESSTVRDILKQSNNRIDEAAVTTLIAMLQDSDSVKLSTVKIPKAGVVVKADSIQSVTCKIQSTVVDKRTPVIFEPEISELLPEDIEIQSALIQLKRGNNTRISLVITNNSKRDIKLSGRLFLGDLELATSITPVEVQHSVKDQNGDRDQTISVDTTGIKAVSEAVDNTTDIHAQGVAGGCSRGCPRGTQQSDNCGSEVKEELDDRQKFFWDQVKKLDMSMLSVEEQNKARQVLWQERESFAIGKEIGCAEELKLEINTTDDVPVQKSYNNIPRPLMNEVKQHVEDLINRQWVTKSASAWSSPVVLVRKKDGKLRLCCDFRKLNAKTVPDKHPLPRVQSSLDSLGGSKWFSVLDQTRAYYQGFIAEQDRHKTAFVTPWGLYQWVRIPFGLTNAPASFQRYMEGVVDGCRDEFAIPYLDDVIVYSATFDDHLEHLQVILQRIKLKGLKLNLEKCRFFQSSVTFLGRIVSQEGYRMDDTNIKSVTALKDFKPKTVTDIRHLMGLIGYHRRHVQDFSRRAKPITDLLLSTRAKENKRMAVEWTTECQTALESLIDSVTSPPILAYPDFEKEFILHTDASNLGLGCILYQKQEDIMRVIGYGSRTLDKAESRYHAAKLEFLAMKWAVTEVFRDYLAYADHFWAFTDNNPLVHLMETPKVNAYSQRWLSELAEYNFTIKYRPGVINRDADCLSRIPLDISTYMNLCTESIEEDAFRAIVCGVTTQQSNNETWKVQIATINADQYVNEDFTDLKTNLQTLQREQRSDPDISVMMECLENPAMSTLKRRIQKDDMVSLKALKRGFKRLKINKDGLLVRQVEGGSRVVLPASMRHLVYEHLHVNMGHLGADRVLDLAKRRVYWPHMQQDIESFISSKCLCIMQKRPHVHGKAPLVNIFTSVPMELVTVDYVHLEKGAGGMEYMLVIVDHFSRYAQAYPTKNKSALTAAKRLYGDFILRFGIPERFMSDQGGEFENKLMHELNKLSGITKLRTSPYHPQTNGLCERMNQTLLSMLRTLPESLKTRWPESVSKMVHAYNCTRHSSTGYSPYFLLFGREPRLPLDLLLGIRNDHCEKTHQQYVKDWKRQMSEAYNIAREKSTAKKLADKKRWDARLMLSKLTVGDRVLVQNKRERGGPGKLRSYWEQKIFVIISVKGEHGVVYEVQEEVNKSAKSRVLHRNMLLPVADDFLLPEPELKRKKVSRDTKSVKMPSKAAKLERDETDSVSAQVLLPNSDTDDSDEEDGMLFYPTADLTNLATQRAHPDVVDNDMISNDHSTNECIPEMQLLEPAPEAEETVDTLEEWMPLETGNTIVDVSQHDEDLDSVGFDRDETKNHDSNDELTPSEDGNTSVDVSRQSEQSSIDQTRLSHSEDNTELLLPEDENGRDALEQDIALDEHITPKTKSRISRVRKRLDDFESRKTQWRSRSIEDRRKKQEEVREQKRCLPKSHSTEHLSSVLDLSPVKDVEGDEEAIAEKQVEEWRRKRDELLTKRSINTELDNVDVEQFDEDIENETRASRPSRIRNPPQKFGYSQLGMPNVNQLSTQTSYSTLQPNYLPHQLSYSPIQPGYSLNDPQYSSLQSSYSPHQVNYMPYQPMYPNYQPMDMSYQQMYPSYQQMYPPYQPTYPPYQSVYPPYHPVYQPH